MRKIQSFRDLKIWRLGKHISIRTYRATRMFPSEEQYALVAQMRRAAVSIPSNIAEGFNRYHNRDFRRFLFISLGSCAELETQTEISYELEYLDRSFRDSLLENLDHQCRMTRALIRKLEASLEQ